MKYLLLLLILVPALRAADDDRSMLDADPQWEALPAEAKAAYVACEKQVAVIRSKADAETLRAKQTLETQLEKAQTTATKAGKLDAALAVKAILEKVQKEEEELKKGFAPKPDMERIKAKVPGNYKYVTPVYSGLWVLQKGGVAKTEGITGTWTVDATGKVTIDWISGRREYINIAENGSVTVELSSGATGTAIVMK